MSEFAPAGRTPKMTKAQVRKYIAELEQKRLKAQLELEKARLAGDLHNEEDLEDLDKKIDDL